MIESIKARGRAAWAWLVALAVEWREVPWTAVLVAGVVFAYYYIPRIDPTAGIDGFGDWFALGVNVLKIMVIAFTAWFCNDHFMVDLSVADEKTLLDRASRGGDALWVLIVQRVSFFCWLLFCWWVATH